MTTTQDESMTEKQNVVSVLKELLSQGDELDRCCACRSLGVLGSLGTQAEATNELVEHLRDDDIDVCIDAAESLGRLGDPAAVEPLIESLHNDPDGDVKVAVVEALGRLGGERAIAELINRVASPTEDVDWDDDEGWDSDWDIQRKAIQALGYLHAAEAVAPLAALLEEEDCQADETDVVLALARIGGAGEQMIIQRLQDGITRERRRAAHALGQTCSSLAARALGRALQDPEPEVRIVAAEALASNGQSQYLGALLLLLRDPADEVRETALRMAEKLSSQSQENLDTEKLLPLLNDPSARVRAAVLRTLLGHMPETLATDTQEQILRLLKDPEPLVVAAAIPHAQCLDNPDVDEILLGLLTDSQLDANVRQQAALTLGHRTDVSTETLLALNAAINDHESIVRWAALQALMTRHKNHPEMADNAHVENVQTENTQDESITPLALILATLRGETLITTIVTEAPTEPVTSGEASSEEQAVTEPMPEAVDETPAPHDDTETAEAIDPPEESEAAPTSTLDAILRANQEYARQGEVKNTLAVDEVPELPADEVEEFQDFYNLLGKQRHNKKKFYRGKKINLASDVRLLSARILGDCSQPEAVKALQEMMHDANPDLQQEAVNALARIAPGTPGLKETLGPLASFLTLGTPDLQVTSARTLGAIGNLNNLTNLQECLHDDNPLLRSQAVLALSQLLEQHAGQPAELSPLHVSNPRQRKENARIESALLDLTECLADSNVGVRKAAALSLAKLNKLFHNSKTRDEIIVRLIAAAYVGEGEQARDMGQALRALDPAAAGDTLLQHLDTLSSSMERRFALEMLEEVFRQQQAA